MKKSNEEVTEFLETLLHYYQSAGRTLPWRIPEPNGTFSGYKVFVSELMLQQTQVTRVIPKFTDFLSVFPDIQTLAEASLGEVLQVWSGLGYNRRAKFLHAAAQDIATRFNGTIPANSDLLISLPGVGKNTAGAILVYTHNLPAVFIETNVRTVWLHTFLREDRQVSDAQIENHLASVLPHAVRAFSGSFRDFYWALMDYGSFLKKTQGTHLQRSSIYTKQSTFQGSKRQLRGAILRQLALAPCPLYKLVNQLSDKRLEQVLRELEREGLIQHVNNVWSLPY